MLTRTLTGAALAPFPRVEQSRHNVFICVNVDTAATQPFVYLNGNEAHGTDLQVCGPTLVA